MDSCLKRVVYKWECVARRLVSNPYGYVIFLVFSSLDHGIEATSKIEFLY